MEIADPIAALLDRLADEAFLDVHVVGVDVGLNVGQVDQVEQRHALGRGVADVGLVAVDHLDADHDVRGSSLLGHPAQHLDDLGDAALGLGFHVFLQGGIDHATEMLGAEVADDGHGGVEQVLAALDRLGVVARDVCGSRQSQGRGRAELMLLQPRPRELQRKP